MEAPYVILSLFAEIGRKSKRGVTIKVYSVSSSIQMEKISCQGSFLKSIPITGTTGNPSESRFIFNDFIIGHVQQQYGDEDIAVHILDKKLLLNPKASEEDCWVRRINLPYDCTRVDINNTSLVCAKDATTWVDLTERGFGLGPEWARDSPKKGELYMISFWMKAAESREY